MASSLREEKKTYTLYFLSSFSFVALTGGLPSRRCSNIFVGKISQGDMKSKKRKVRRASKLFALVFSAYSVIGCFQVLRGPLFTYRVQASFCVCTYGEGSFSYEVTSHQFRSVAKEGLLPPPLCWGPPFFGTCLGLGPAFCGMLQSQPPWVSFSALPLLAVIL